MHQYQLLGHSVHGDVSIEPCLITLDKDSGVYPIFQHAGVEFAYILEGRMICRQLNANYKLAPGDSLFFDSDAAHGPEELVELPVSFLSVITLREIPERDQDSDGRYSDREMICRWISAT